MKNPFEQPSSTEKLASSTSQLTLELSEIQKKLEQLGVDPGIRETVAILNKLGFTTTESCEGHLDHGNIAPRVTMEAPKSPRWRFVGEQEAYTAAAQKAGFTLEELLEYARPKYGEVTSHDEEKEESLAQVLLRAREQTPREEETEEFKLWRNETDALFLQLRTLLEEYSAQNPNKTFPEDTQLSVDLRDEPEFSSYVFTLHNGGAHYLEMADPDALQALPPNVQEERQLKHAAYQKEMRAFTEFLKQKLEGVN